MYGRSGSISGSVSLVLKMLVARPNRDEYTVTKRTTTIGRTSQFGLSHVARTNKPTIGMRQPASWIQNELNEAVAAAEYQE